jgi:hypothetical protein
LPMLSALTSLHHKSTPLNICQTIVQGMISSIPHLLVLTRICHY